VVEYAADQVQEERLTLDGAESQTEFMNSPRVTTARLSPDAGSVLVESVVMFNRGGSISRLTIKDTWRLIEGGDGLSISRSVSSARGDQQLTLVFSKR
jgi:hypothetical protein